MIENKNFVFDDNKLIKNEPQSSTIIYLMKLTEIKSTRLIV